MKHRLPPLNSLRAFESAARHLSFTRAAAELNVTPGAISQQVKRLEDYLGVRLFRRCNQKILLTDPARAYLPLISAGFTQLAAAVDSIHHANTNRPLTVTVSPTLGARWLAPRLGAFHKAHPDMSIRIDASVELVDLARDDIDLGIRFGDGVYPDLDSVPLFSTCAYPVCSPALLKTGPKLETPQDLEAHTLLHPEYPWGDFWPDWQTWLCAVGITDIDTSHGIRFTSPEMVIQAALGGQGVALFGGVLVETDLRCGRLVRPLKESLALDCAYHIVHTHNRAEWPRVKLFKAWLLEQAKHSESTVPPIKNSHTE